MKIAPMRASLLPFVLGMLAACAANPAANGTAPAADGAALERLRMEMQFGGLLSAPSDELRTGLQFQFARDELEHPGFDGVTPSQCIDWLVAAITAARRDGVDVLHDRRVKTAFADYVSVHREAIVRRTAGKASCMPTLR